MKIDVITLDGGKAGAVELPDDIFGIEEIRGDILQRCVTWQLAKRRAGTHKVQIAQRESRAPARRCTARRAPAAPVTARAARRSSSAAPARFGPVVRSHEFDLPKKVRALALRHALSSKAKDRRRWSCSSAATLEDAEDRRPARRLRQARPQERPGHRRAPRWTANLQAGRAQHPEHRRAAERRPQRLRRPASRHAGADQGRGRGHRAPASPSQGGRLMAATARHYDTILVAGDHREGDAALRAEQGGVPRRHARDQGRDRRRRSRSCSRSRWSRSTP